MNSGTLGFPLGAINAAKPQTKYKKSDQTVTDTTTVANDADLIFNVKAGKKYKIIGSLLAATSASSGMKFDFGNTIATPSNVFFSGKFWGSGSANGNSAALGTAVG